jgi:molecular chaperone DnaJ
MSRLRRELPLHQCYAALGIEQGAGPEEIKRAYRRRAFELHPDLTPDRPGSGREFQVVNEAYVILTGLAAAERDAPGKEKGKEAEQAARPEREREKEASDDAQRAASSSEAGPGADGAGEETRRETDGGRAQRAAHAAYTKEEDVLRDLLNDPFARRVFEDIYAQMRSGEAAPPPPPPPRAEKNAPAAETEAEWDRIPRYPDFNNGIGRAVRGWMRRQIDEQQTFHLSPAVLLPGARIRLQIRRGISDEISTVEVTLPKDYTAGKAVRLKGMGKHIGPWQGDLYLTFVPKT